MTFVLVIVIFEMFLLSQKCLHLLHCISDMNPLLKLGDLEQAEDVVQDTASSYLMCVSESWEKQSKELTVGLVVRAFFFLRNLNSAEIYGVSVHPYI